LSHVYQGRGASEQPARDMRLTTGSAWIRRMHSIVHRMFWRLIDSETNETRRCGSWSTDAVEGSYHSSASTSKWSPC